jgi:hypothetical protein
MMPKPTNLSILPCQSWIKDPWYRFLKNVTVHPIGTIPQGSVDGILTSSPTYYNSPKEFKEIGPIEGKPNEQ